MRRFVLLFTALALPAGTCIAAVQFAWTDIHFPVEGRRYTYEGTFTNLTLGGPSQLVDATREYANVQPTADGVRFDVTTSIRFRDTAAVLEYVESRQLTATSEVLLRRVERNGSIITTGFENLTYADAAVAPRTFEIGQRYDYSNLYTGSASGREERSVTTGPVESAATGLGPLQAARIQTTVRNATGTIPQFLYGETGWYARNVGPVRLQISTNLRGLFDLSLTAANFALAPLAFEGTGPQITAEPESMAVAAGATARFRVLATGDGLTWSWTKDGVTIPGATAATLTLPAATAADDGLYRATVTSSGVTLQSRPARLTVTAEGPGESSRLANLSVRAHTGDGGAQLIAGLSIQATRTPHRLLIRGLGPGFASFVPAAVKDPALAVRDASGTLLAENDDWGQSSDPAALRALMAELGAFAIPSDSKDAALLVPLGNGNFTALVRDATGGTGLVECYDADAELTGGFGNLSARADVRTEPLIAGIVVSGSGSSRLLVRAVGPTLARFGVGNAFANPTLRLVAASGADIAVNDDWSTSAQLEELRAAFASIGAFPLDENSRDAALIATVPAGSYTAVIDSGALGGIALVEVYRLPAR